MANTKVNNPYNIDSIKNNYISSSDILQKISYIYGSIYIIPEFKEIDGNIAVNGFARESELNKISFGNDIGTTISGGLQNSITYKLDYFLIQYSNNIDSNMTEYGKEVKAFGIALIPSSFDNILFPDKIKIIFDGYLDSLILKKQLTTNPILIYKFENNDDNIDNKLSLYNLETGLYKSRFNEYVAYLSMAD